jgi:hypothetical protein
MGTQIHLATDRGALAPSAEIARLAGEGGCRPPLFRPLPGELGRTALPRRDAMRRQWMLRAREAAGP